MNNDLISRSALLAELNDTKYAWQDYDSVEGALRNIPAVDAVIPVRCKDCAKDGLTTCPICYIEKETLQFINHDPDFFCGDGERKEG